MSRDGKEFGFTVVGISKRGEPTPTATKNGWGDSDCFDICDRRGASKTTNSSRERRLETRLSLLALQTLNQSRLFPTNICTGTTMKIDIIVVAVTTGILSKKPSGIGFMNRFIKVSQPH
jgi:hypothetical protein